jgi:hypothetical protein
VGVHRSMFRLAERLAWAETRDDFERVLEKRVRDPDQPTQEKRRQEVRKAAMHIGVPENKRDVEQVIALLPVLATGSSSKTMAENWIPRLQELVESLGDSIKTGADGGIDLVKYLHNADDGQGFMYALNSFSDVSNRERFARIATLEVLRAADTVGNLSLAFDEVGLMGAKLFAESVRVLRVRLCTGLFASHIESDFPKVLKGLIKVWFLGQVPSSDDDTQRFESSVTSKLIPPEHFGEHALPEGHFHLVANGRVQYVKVPTWRTRSVPTTAGTADASRTWNARSFASAGSSRNGGLDEENDGNDAENDAEQAWEDGWDEGMGEPEVDEDVLDRPYDDEGDEVEAVEDIDEDEADAWQEPPEWLNGEKQLINIYQHVEIVAAGAPGVKPHRLSTYHPNNRGRPMATYGPRPNNDWLPYALMLAMAEGRDLTEVRIRMRDQTLQGLTADHLCRELDPTITEADEMRCQEISHLQWKTRGGNTRVQWARKRRRGTAA